MAGAGKGAILPAVRSALRRLNAGELTLEAVAQDVVAALARGTAEANHAALAEQRFLAAQRELAYCPRSPDRFRSTIDRR